MWGRTDHDGGEMRADEELGREVMRARFLGTGTSCGIPIIGCDCAVCRSQDPRDRRRRTSLYVQAGGLSLLVDTTPDFREQALAYALPRVDAVFFTHAHADHIFGFDDIRRYNTIQKAVIPAYADAFTLGELKRVFSYVCGDNKLGTYRPEIAFCEMRDEVTLGAVTVEALPVVHGDRPTQGYLFCFGGRRLAYVPDCKEMPPETLARVRGADVVVLDALRHRPHATHMTVKESLACLAEMGCEHAYLIHMCHEVSHTGLSRELPPGVEVAYDGLQIEI